MKKENKNFEKVKERMEKLKSGDGDELLYNPFKKHVDSILSLGKSKDIKSLKVSSKKRIGNAVNKNINKRYNGVEKTLKRILKDRK